MEQSFLSIPQHLTELNLKSNIYKSIRQTTLTVSLKQYLKISERLCVPAVELINLSFNEGKFRAALKIARVTTILRKSHRLGVNNCRSISLILAISKIIQKLIHKRLNFSWNKTIFFTHLILISETIIEQHIPLLK